MNTHFNSFLRHGAVFVLALLPVVAPAQQLDTLIFGNSTSENSHSLSNYFTQVVTINHQTARQCTIALPTNIYGGNLTFTMAVDPLRRNYFSVKLSGDEDGLPGVNGRLYLYVPAAQYTPGSTNNYQIGYRHEGDYMPLSVVSDHPPLPGRFFYSTTLLPLWMTQGRTNLIFKIVSTGRIYPLGSGDQNSGGNYQFDMATNSRSIFRAYTHTDPFLISTGEIQGSAPAASIRPSPGPEVLLPGGIYYNGISNYFAGRLSATVNVNNFGTSDAELLALSYSMTNMFTDTNPAVVARVILICDAYATNYFANPNNVSSGGNEGWGGRYGHLGYAISLLATQLSSNLDTLANYGAGGTITRRSAWGQMLAASRDYGRFGRDGHAISNQGMTADRNIYLANKGLLALNDSNAFTETNAQCYLKEAVGLLPWLGSDLPAGGSSLLHGTNYFMVTSKGLTKEYGYVGTDYGEMQANAADYYRFTGNTIFSNQMVKMVKARAPFRRPTMELVSGSYYQNMEGIGLLAWRGASESDGNYADDHVAYADREVTGMSEAALAPDPAVVGYAKQNLADNQFFYGLTENSANYNNLNFDSIGGLFPFADYLTVASLPDSGIRLPMTDGQPDFAWADEGDGIVALKHGGERLWISAYWQAKTGTAINAAARFHYSTTNYDQYGVLETTPVFNYTGSYYLRNGNMDKLEQNFYVPYDNPLEAYANERLPVGPTPPFATDDEPFRGKASFYAFRFGHYLIGLNMSVNTSYPLQVPPGYVPGTNLINGASVTVPVMVGPTSTVVLYLDSATNSNPVPSTPLVLNAVGNSASLVALDWNAASGATGYNLKRSTVSGGSYTTIANVTGTNYTDSNVTRGVTYYYVVSGTNSFGESDYNSMEASASAGLPSPWLDTDIGVVGTAGSANYLNTGVFTVRGAGSDFAYVSVTNNAAIIAHLSAQQLAGGGADKVGVMMRETTNANSQIQGLIIDLQQGSQARFPMRYGTGSGVQWQQISGSFPAPVWLKLTRTNNLFNGYVSTNGTDWIGVGTNTIPIATNYLVGLAVCSRTTLALDVSTFDNVTTPVWTSPLADTPTGLAALAGDARAVLTWNAATNAVSYNLKRSLTNGGPYLVVGSGLSSPAFTDTGLTNGTIYYYVVSSTNPIGESTDSAPVSVQPVSQSVTALNFESVGGQIQFFWPQDHTGWTLQVQTNSLSAGLGTNWSPVANSSGTNQIFIPLNSTCGSVFFRLVYP
jgi:hypothetical protein